MCYALSPVADTIRGSGVAWAHVALVGLVDVRCCWWAGHWWKLGRVAPRARQSCLHVSGAVGAFQCCGRSRVAVWKAPLALLRNRDHAAPSSLCCCSSVCLECCRCGGAMEPCFEPRAVASCVVCRLRRCAFLRIAVPHRIVFVVTAQGAAVSVLGLCACDRGCWRSCRSCTAIDGCLGG